MSRLTRGQTSAEELELQGDGPEDGRADEGGRRGRQPPSRPEEAQEDVEERVVHG